MGKVITIVLVIIAASAIYVFSSRDSAETTPTPTVTAEPDTSTPVLPTPTATATPTPTVASTPAPTPTPSTVSFVITGDDNGASMESLAVSRGSTVQITFNVSNQNVYHGGLEFRGGPVDTGPIPPGGSKTISFVAESSFTIIPYWPNSGVRKGYNIQVNVQ